MIVKLTGLHDSTVLVNANHVTCVQQSQFDKTVDDVVYVKPMMIIC